ncbi:copper homeostasis protein CutC [Escherichia coli]
MGADRVELCAAPKRGLTPSLGVLKSVRERVTIPCIRVADAVVIF